jgi:hypothetical protein
VRDLGTKNLELYDLSNDLGEAHNVAAQHPDVVATFNEYFRTARNDSADWPLAMSKARGNNKAAESAE